MLSNELWYQLHLPRMLTEFGDSCLEIESTSAGTQLEISGPGRGVMRKTEGKEVPIWSLLTTSRLRRREGNVQLASPLAKGRGETEGWNLGNPTAPYELGGPPAVYKQSCRHGNCRGRGWRDRVEVARRGSCWAATDYNDLSQ